MITKGFFALAGVAFALTLSSSASAMDLDQVKAKATPEEGSAQWAEVCAATYMAQAYTATGDEQQGALTLGKAWIKLALEANGKTYDDYIDNQLTGDMQGLYDSGDDVVGFYKTYCAQQSQKMLNS